MNKRHKSAISSLIEMVASAYDQLNVGDIPCIPIPLRDKKNIKFDPRYNVWKYGSLKSIRSAKTVQGAMMMLRTIYTVNFIKEMIKTNKSSTLREMYYISEGWKNAKFGSQDESNSLAEDLEVATGCMREDFKLRPEESGAKVYGDLNFSIPTTKGTWRKSNCIDDVSAEGFTIPYKVEEDSFKIELGNTKFIIAIETGGMYARLVENGFPEKNNCTLIHLSGQPARSTRRLIKRLNEEYGLPTAVFTDGDPWSFRIYASVAYGAIKTAHISDYLATPAAKFIGITASDITNYELPTDKLNDKDINALNSELLDPRFENKFWTTEIKAMLDMGKKAEQQALAKYGLDYVTDKYLPEKLVNIGII